MNQTETTRREMYRKLADLKSNLTGVMVMQWFEDSLEEHLEALRQQQATTTEAHRQATIAGGMLCEKLDSAEEVARVLKAQIAELLRENDRLRIDRSKYKQWMRSAVRQNKAERKNVKAFRETQDELLCQIEALHRQLSAREQSGLPAMAVTRYFANSHKLPTGVAMIVPQNAQQEPK